LDIKMARIGIKDAFATYGANLHNVQWSVSAWAADGSLVVSLWAHHYRAGPSGTVEYADSLARWKGPGNNEFRKNVAKAFAKRSRVRLVVASTIETSHVQAGEDASKIKKDFDPKVDLIGKVAELDGENYVFRFARGVGSGT
jgi:hypothetical protein